MLIPCFFSPCSTISFYDYSSGRSFLSSYFWGVIATQQGKKKIIDLFLSFTKQGCLKLFHYFWGFIFALSFPSHGSAGPFFLFFSVAIDTYSSCINTRIVIINITPNTLHTHTSPRLQLIFVLCFFM